MNNCNCNCNTQVSCPTIDITLTASATRLAPCDLITYTASITNQDKNVTYGYFKDKLPTP